MAKLTKESFIESLKEMSLLEKSVKTKEEVLMYTAAMLYAQNEEFPYDLQLTEETVKTEIADMTNMKIVRKKETIYEWFQLYRKNEWWRFGSV